MLWIHCPFDGCLGGAAHNDHRCGPQTGQIATPAEPHLAAWRHCNQTIGVDGTVGFWHETYMSEPGKHEVVYGNMPLFGLAAAARHVPAVGRRETARRLLGSENVPAVPSPATPGVES